MTSTEYVPLDDTTALAFTSTVKSIFELTTAPIVPPLTNINSLGSLRAQTIRVSLNYAASAGFGPVASGSVTGKTEYYVYELVRPVVVQGTIEGPITSATYGIGARFLMRVSTAEADFKVSLGNVAAAVQLGRVDASVSLKLFGLGAHLASITIPPDLFTFSDFDMETYEAANALIRELSVKLKDLPADSVNPTLLGVELRRLYSDDLEDALQSGNYALWRIAKGDSLTTALATAAKFKVPVDRDLIQRTYALQLQRPQLALPGAETTEFGKAEPDRTQSRAAKHLVTQYRFVTKADGTSEDA